MDSRDGIEKQQEGYEEGYYRKLLVASLFLITLIIFGNFHSFGVFLKPLADRLGTTRAAVSGAISIAWLMHGIFGVLSGIAGDRWGPRPVMAAGSLVIAVAYMLMVTGASLWHLYVFVGFMLGAGMGPIWVVSSTVTAQWFSRRRGLSLGVVMAGPGAGHFIIPPLSRYLIAGFGLHTAYLILGLLVLAIALPLSFILRPAPIMMDTWKTQSTLSEQTTETNLTIKAAIRTRSFWFLFGIWLLVPLSIQIMRVHIFPFALDQGIGEATASFMFFFMGAGIVVGRISWGALADHFGSKRIFKLVLVLLMMVQFSAMGASTLWSFYSLAMFFGFVMAGNDPVFVKLITEFFGSRHGGTLLGIFTFAFTISSAAGPFLAGLIYDRTESYFGAFSMAGVAVLVALMLLQALKPPISQES